MYKPDSLRAHIAASVPDLKSNPDKISIFIDEGGLQATSSGSYSFAYDYTLNMIITDYAGKADAIMVPLLAWIRIHQIDLLDNPERRKTGIKFEVDINNNDSVDIDIKLSLTERVIVKEDENNVLQITHVAEPQMMPNYSDDKFSLYQGENLLAEWVTPTLP